MSECVCVYIYMYVYIYIHTYIHTCVCTYILDGMASLNDLSNMVSASFLSGIQRSGESIGESSMSSSSIMCRCSSARSQTP